jgi:RHS repeat-associated protein
VADGLYWLTTRAYDPTLGRFLARDPLGRVPLFFADNPYVYAGTNPLSNVDPSGQYRAAGHGSTARESGAATNRMMARVVARHGTPGKGGGSAGCGGCKQVQPKASPPPTRYDSYGCTVGDRECDAQQMAVGDAAIWGIIALVLAAIDAIAWANSALPFIGAVFVAAATAIAVAVVVAGTIGLLFAVEGAHPEPWYTVEANLTTFANQVETALVAITALTAIVSTFLIAVPPAAAVAGTVKVLSLALGIGFMALFRSEMDAQEEALGYA